LVGQTDSLDKKLDNILEELKKENQSETKKPEAQKEHVVINVANEATETQDIDTG